MRRSDRDDCLDPGLVHLRKLVEEQGRQQFRVAVRQHALEMAEILNVGVAALKEQEPEVNFTKMIPLDQYAFVGDSDDGFHVASAVLSAQRPEAARWAASQAGYVFAPEAAVLPVFLAARFVLLSDYQYDCGEDAYLPTRLDPEAIRGAEQKLKSSGKYDVKPIGSSLMPRLQTHKEAMLETFLKSAWPRIEKLAIRFGPYQAHGSGPISPASIAVFLRQFGEDKLARPALRVLQNTLLV